MSVKKPSEKQQTASRTNGAKSKGPATPEGRARSSRNSLRHGLSAAVVVLPHEDRAQFESLRDSYMESFQPADQPQHDLVETMAAARWRLNRLQEIEAKLFEMEMVRREKEMSKQLIEMTEVERLAWVFDNLANHSKSLAMQIRYEGSLNRSYERAFKQLQQLQSRPQLPPSPQQNEPEPTVEHALVRATSALMPTPGQRKNPPPPPSRPPATPKTPPTSPQSPQKEESNLNPVA
ncbi:MAG TPA: hypothetical protein VN841_16340 [Bryobacteraceae bacterium]|nr:hypothetical protein [Bryobacteraceae bacterium]